MDKQSSQAPIDKETKGRSEPATAWNEAPEAEPSPSTMRQELADDDLPAGEHNEVSAGPVANDDGLINASEALNARILLRREGLPITIDIVDRVRSERDDELTIP